MVFGWTKSAFFDFRAFAPIYKLPACYILKKQFTWLTLYFDPFHLAASDQGLTSLKEKKAFNIRKLRKS